MRYCRRIFDFLHYFLHSYSLSSTLHCYASQLTVLSRAGRGLHLAPTGRDFSLIARQSNRWANAHFKAQCRAQVAHQLPVLLLHSIWHVQHRGHSEAFRDTRTVFWPENHKGWAGPCSNTQRCSHEGLHKAIHTPSKYKKGSHTDEKLSVYTGDISEGGIRFFFSLGIKATSWIFKGEIYPAFLPNHVK